MRITIHIRVILWLIGIYALLYLIVGIQQSNFYKRVSSGRAQLASVDKGDIHVGILYIKGGDGTAFVNGVDLAVDEVNNRTNDIGGKGIIFRLPDKKSAISRKIHPVYLPVKSSTDLTIASPLSSDLMWNKRLVAIVSGLTTTMTLRTMVIPEYFGIAVIAVRPTLPSLTQEDFQYFVRTVPNYQYLARYFMNDIPLTIAKKSGKRIKRIGIFFSSSSPEGYLDGLITAREKVNERIVTVQNLRAGFESGLLNELNDIEDLREKTYMQTSLDLDPIRIEEFITNNLSEADIKKPITLKEIIERYDPDETPTEFVFTKPFMPRVKDYRPIIVSAEKSNPDLIVIASGIPDSLTLVRQIREMGIEKPVMVTRINEYEELLDIPTERLNNIYGAAMYDPNSQDQRFISFKDRYERFLRVNNRIVQSPDFLSIQGYEAVHLIAQVIEKSSSTIPMNICNTLKYSTSPLEGQLFQSYSFSPGGDVLNRKLYTLFFDKGTMTTIKEQE
ncbi:MAG: ABC transporter substrate-binding protein [Candidatus Xenobiia bacterium LiM19]